MPNEPLIHWPDPIVELIGFLTVFLSAGAVGFRFAVLPGARRIAAEIERPFLRSAERRAALFGLLGAVAGAVLFAMDLPDSAARRHLTILALLTSQPMTGVRALFQILGLAGFLLALAGRRAGWLLAAAAVVLSPLRGVFMGQASRIVNPSHELAAGLWIGTLLLMVAAGIAPALRAPFAAERRGALVAGMVGGFSPLALTASAALAVLGVITAWTHLKKLDALWTTPYGFTLIAKLVVVAGVVALGAWNWRRQKPRLGSEAGAVALRGSATFELALAGGVLLITSVLVSLPSP